MATATSDFRFTSRTSGPVGDQCIVLQDVGWEGYHAMLQLRGERPRPRLIYLDGSVYLVTASFLHEFLRKRLGMFVTEVLVGLEIPFAPAGETTLRLHSKRGGVEGDETFYIANEVHIRGKRKIELPQDPPPDLAIEVVHTHAADASIEIYRRFGVPEIWVWEDENLQILLLQANGAYAESLTSTTIPRLSAAEVTGWIMRQRETSELEWILELRRWIRDILLPRVRGQAPEEPTV